MGSVGAWWEAKFARRRRLSMFIYCMFLCVSICRVNPWVNMEHGRLVLLTQRGCMCVCAHTQGFAAANSGQVRIGDFVMAIDDQPVEGWELENIKQLTIGDEGTMCTLTIKRGKLLDTDSRSSESQWYMCGCVRGRAFARACVRRQGAPRAFRHANRLSYLVG